jgi:hypothetical protein
MSAKHALENNRQCGHSIKAILDEYITRLNGSKKEL